jgi:hypothetical protein
MITKTFILAKDNYRIEAVSEGCGGAGLHLRGRAGVSVCVDMR